MLDSNTKRRIDTARDILVGKVPDPKSQVEQITIALVYKFMGDMDSMSEELGGKRSFFADEFARYGWTKLMRSGLSGHETLNLYAEAIAKMPENPGIPPLFREIFSNAYLPYRDPETLRAFLKVIDEFTYDHSERLGDAFEYLLSVLGSQGDAGQFRTPRHIIDFIVAIIEPKKGELVLDPACGTAGFLISSYKHILAANADTQGGSMLTPDEKSLLAANFKGYDISPDMVRLSLVNMYLHGFADPHIFEYDTLTSEERWNEYADVILANPPFMSPKGGIQPHNRFSVQSKRSEVLFVDYIAEHLTPSGRAGIIVPEGIIFQSQNAYKKLRKMLVESYLVAVVSLPAGVFNPYSGVKTSILILDKSLAKKANCVAFFKVENDGFDLGGQRRPIDESDLPQVQTEIAEYLRHLRDGRFMDNSQRIPKSSVARKDEDYKSGNLQTTLSLFTEKEKIAFNGEYNLSGERYHEKTVLTTTWPLTALGEVCVLVRGVTYKKLDEVSYGGYKVLRANNISKEYSNLDLSDVKRVSVSTNFPDAKRLQKGDIFICLASGSKAHIGKVAFIEEDMDYYFGGFMGAIRVKQEVLIPAFLFHQLNYFRFNKFLRQEITGTSINNLGSTILFRFQIPLPPLEMQNEIVAKIKGYQKIVDGGRAVIENYNPQIPIEPSWPMVAISDVCVINPNTVKPQDLYPDSYFNYIDISCVEKGTGKFLGANKIASAEAPSRARRGIKRDDVLVSTVRPNLRAFTILTEIPHRAIASTGFAVIRPKDDRLLPQYLIHIVRSEYSVAQMVRVMGKGSYPSINQADVESIQIHLPPLEVQKEVVDEIAMEKILMEANRELIERFEKKISAVIGRVWGETRPSTAEE